MREQIIQIEGIRLLIPNIFLLPPWYTLLLYEALNPRICRVSRVRLAYRVDRLPVPRYSTPHILPNESWIGREEKLRILFSDRSCRLAEFSRLTVNPTVSPASGDLS